MGKVYKILFFAITLLILINFSVNSFLKPANVKYDGINQELSLQNDVEVFFDDYGVPSVFAETLARGKLTVAPGSIDVQ